MNDSLCMVEIVAPWLMFNSLQTFVINSLTDVLFWLPSFPHKNVNAVVVFTED